MSGVSKSLVLISTTLLVIVVVIVLHVFDLGKRIPYYPVQLIENRARNRSTRPAQPCQCMIILRERSGRLGNRLFMFAAALGLALNHSCCLNISAEIIHELNRSFLLDLQQMPISSVSTRSEYEKRRIYNHCSYLTDLFRANTSQTIELTGFWQVQTYFSDYSVEIRRQLRFKSSVLHQVDTFLNNTIINSTRVGIHIRRGDFLRVRAVSSDQYVLDAMSYFTRKYHSVVFVIVSDDRPHCQNVFGKRKDVLFTPVAFDGVMDLATLTRCHHAIITVGTFGWWGAYLLHDRAGEVVADAKKDLTPVDANCHGKLYFPPWFSFLNKTL